MLKVGANPDGKDSRDVTVLPVDSEENLRHLAWIEGNRSTPAREPNEASEPVFDVGGVEKQTGAVAGPCFVLPRRLVTPRR